MLIGQITHGVEDRQAMLVDPDSEHWKQFDAFLESWSAQEVQIDGVARRRLSQWAQLVDAHGLLLTDDIGRFETFTQDAVRLFGKMGISCRRLPVINSSLHRHYSLYYSDFGRELVEQVFREDVEQFGYRFDDSVGEAGVGA
jgi:hypothetical protein